MASTTPGYKKHGGKSGPGNWEMAIRLEVGTVVGGLRDGEREESRLGDAEGCYGWISTWQITRGDSWSR